VPFVGAVAEWSAFSESVTHDMRLLSRWGPFLGPEARLIDKGVRGCSM
jgi:hypothetical protein